MAGIRKTWGSYKEAVVCVEKGLAQGIGSEFDGDGIYGVDIDHVISDGKIADQIWDIVGKLNSYTEVSPSGTGMHIFVLAPGAEITRHRKKGFFLEIYGDRRYFTVTGDVYGGLKPIATRTAELQAIHDKYLLPETARTPVRIATPESANSADHDRFLQLGLQRDRVFAALWAGERRNGNESADDIALMNKLAYWCNADSGAIIKAFLSSPYHAQKDHAHMKKCQRSDYLANTAKNACDTVYSTAAVDYERWQNRKRERGNVR
jgi:putative DNA primase/helicase